MSNEIDSVSIIDEGTIIKDPDTGAVMRIIPNPNIAASEPFTTITNKDNTLDFSLSAPWYGFIRKVYALFCKDPDITNIIYDKDEYHLKLYVNNVAKADAISQLIGTERVFDKITLKISVIPSNDGQRLIDLYRIAFYGNPIFNDIISNDDIYAPSMNYVLFQNTTAQYFNDRLDHPQKIETHLYEDLARDVFADNSDGVHFGTACEECIMWP